MSEVSVAVRSTGAYDPEVAALAALGARGSTESFLAELIGRRYAGRIALVSSFGAEAAVLLHLVAGIDRRTPVILLDTGKLFAETLAYRDALIGRLGLGDVRNVGPADASLARADPAGDLWRRDPDLCCQLRKVEPLERALGGFDSWINGRKRFQGPGRAAVPLVERDGERIKVTPLADWSSAKIAAYLDKHELPRHPLTALGYGSIGCAPCSTPTAAGEGARAGRWRGTEKTECGIHFVGNTSARSE